MKIRLQKITKHNWQQAIKLPTSEDHKHFVASNVYSIAQVQFHPGINAYGIYNDEVMVGFAMYGTLEELEEDEDGPDRRFWIWRLMIAEGERFKGYGREAMKLIIAEARNSNQRVVVLSTEPSNEKAIKFYESLGFKATGVVEDGEEIFILELNNS